MSCHHEATNDKQRWVKMDRFVSWTEKVIIIITREYRQTLNAKPTRKGQSISTGRTTIELLIFYIDCCRVINISIQGRQLFRAHTILVALVVCRKLPLYHLSSRQPPPFATRHATFRPFSYSPDHQLPCHDPPVPALFASTCWKTSNQK